MNGTIKVVILDDEPLARAVLTDYVGRVPDLELIACCKNALEAFSLLGKQQVDLLLLDINMPEINGIELLKTLRNPPAVIFTTAYPEYAVESYDLNALDYLLKPIPFERFLKAIDKLSNPVEHIPQAAMPGVPKADVLFVKSEGRLIKIQLSELQFVEGLKDYLKLGLTSGKLVIYGTMKNMEEELKKHEHFIRVNKSYIVNMRSITEVVGHTILIKDLIIPIGNTYRTGILQLLNRHKLL
jgi:DNA-binding LytR/AlgR family response regulator